MSLEPIVRGNRRFIIDGFLQLRVSLLLYSLGILELLDQLHLQHLHLHHLGLLLLDHLLLFGDLSGDICSRGGVLLGSEFFDLGFLKPLLLLEHLGFKFLLLLLLELPLHCPLLVLSAYEFGLFSLLLLVKDDRVFDLLLLCFSSGFLGNHSLSILLNFLLLDGLLL